MSASPEQALASMIANLKAKTGKSLDEWIKIAKSSKLLKHGEIVSFLKKNHELTHGYANLVAHKLLGSDAGSADDSTDLVAQQYGGAKAGLRPIYDKLLACIKKFGPDVEVSPKKAYVSLRRKKQFAIVQPSTAVRLDVGINLKDAKPTARLEASGSFNSMVSHRVRVEKSADIDSELLDWIKKAYEGS